MPFESLAEIEHALRSPRVDGKTLHAIWDQRRPLADPARKISESTISGSQLDWLRDGVTLSRFAESALAEMELLLVCDFAREALRLEVGADADLRRELVKVRMTYARALMKLGATREAQAELGPVAKGADPKLAASIYTLRGDIAREESHHTAAQAMRQQRLMDALEDYRIALALDPSSLETNIVAAAVALILGDRAAAADGAAKTRSLVREMERSDGPSFFTRVAAAAALVIDGRPEEAASVYQQLKDAPLATTTRLAEARYYATFLAEAAGHPRDHFRAAFPRLELLVFAGHTIERFPTKIDAVRDAIRDGLAKLDARVGLASASAGGDLLFLDELLKRDGAAHIVLPWEKDQFRSDWVDRFDASTPVWGPLFDRALDRAATVREFGQRHQPSDDVGWRYMFEVAAGLAFSTARTAHLDVQPIVLSCGAPDSRVGTEWFARYWQQHLGLKPVVIEIPGGSDVEGFAPIVTQRIERPIMEQQVKSMLFADIVGYSRLTEHVIPDFIEKFMGRAAELAASSKHAPVSLNTWGDAVYAVFDTAGAAGAFALELVQMIHEHEAEWLAAGLYWESGGTKHALNIRVGLHTGPVFLHYDPIVRRLGYTGAHVNRAARIEPVARPGEVFASEEFSALAELSAEIARRQPDEAPDTASAGFVCEFAGSMQLAKNFPGRFRIYRVLPKRELMIEPLARAAHERYRAESRARGETEASNPAMREWENLPEDLRGANRAQVADIPNKLRLLGYEIAPLHGLDPATVPISDEWMDFLARREHSRWAAERRRQGWTFGTPRDNARKRHPLLVTWEELSEPEREKDRDAVRNVAWLLSHAGFRLRKLAADA